MTLCIGLHVCVSKALPDPRSSIYIDIRNIRLTTLTGNFQADLSCLISNIDRYI